MRAQRDQSRKYDGTTHEPESSGGWGGGNFFEHAV
jgi:hypothetical protein